VCIEFAAVGLRSGVSHTRRMLAMLRRLSLARQWLILQVLVVITVVALGGALTYVDEGARARERAGEQVLAVASVVAALPEVTELVARGDPHGRLQPLAESLRLASGADFVVVMSPDRIRYSHPNPDMVGRAFIGTTAPAERGTTFTETYTGTLGPSVRAVAPVWGADGSVIGMVAVGIVTSAIGERVAERLPLILLVSLLVVAAAGGATLLISRWVRRSTLGLGAEEITRLYQHHDVVLHSMQEGLVVVDSARRLVLVNQGARRLLGLDAGAEGRPVADLPLPPSVRELLLSGRTVHDELLVADEAVVVASQTPARRGGHDAGTVVTLRDHTELLGLTHELDSVRGFADSLRAQAHEAANRLHSVVTLVELGRTEEAVDFAVAELQASQGLADRLLDAVEEPVLAALLLGKVAQARERGVDLVVSPRTQLGVTWISVRDLVSVMGNLLDNAVEAALTTPPPRSVEVVVTEEGGEVVVRVEDSGPGLRGRRLEQLVTQGWTTKDGGGAGRGLGLALVDSVVRRHGGRLEADDAERRDGGAVFTVRLPLPSDAVPVVPGELEPA
jgi:two-component system CitB family sensor kinase